MLRVSLDVSMLLQRRSVCIGCGNRGKAFSLAVGPVWLVDMLEEDSAFHTETNKNKM